MQWRNDTHRYGALTIGLHWLMLLLLAAVYACMEFKGIFPRGSAGRAAMQSTHFMLGLSVGVLVLVRILVVATGAIPRIVPPLPKAQSLLATLMKLALYAFMLAMPVLGWLILSARGNVIPFYGLHLPALIGPSKETAGWIKGIHVTLANTGYFLIGGHAAAALFHHYVVRDNTLLRMLPKRD